MLRALYHLSILPHPGSARRTYLERTRSDAGAALSRILLWRQNNSMSKVLSDGFAQGCSGPCPEPRVSATEPSNASTLLQPKLCPVQRSDLKRAGTLSVVLWTLLDSDGGSQEPEA